MDDILVVKLGGGLPADPLLDEIAELTAAATPVVVVHGGGGEADRLAGQLGRPVRTLLSPDGTRSRRTDEDALDVLAMALLGRVKPALVQGLRSRGVLAAGLSGADGGLLTAERRPAVRSVENGRTLLVRDDRSGRITGARPAVLRALLGEGIVPVVSPPAADPSGRLLNVDSDQAAAALAGALGAAALVLLTGVPGVLRDPADPASVIPEIDCAAPTLAEAGGRMRHKVRAAARARQAGVRRVVIAAAAVPGPVGAALRGSGTVFTTPSDPERRPA
ncbi:[LysW]-aminoadipate kinase [Kitasatospora sp. NPDC059673]|uniref:[LysW]-aminoadipate kinase n=1 Tax=Kitasatospora sp. NPDC059673 TaxID=3346901 RepID=UPI0036BED6CF